MNRVILMAGLLFYSLNGVSSELIRSIESIVHNHEVIRGEFVQKKNLSGVDRTLKSTGYFIVDKSNGISWQTQTPFKTTTIIKKGEIVQKSGGKVLMSLSSEKEPSIKFVTTILFSTLSGDFESLKSLFLIDGQISSDKKWSVSLIPKDSGMKSIIKGINLSGSTSINSVELLMASGDKTSVIFSNVEDATHLREKYLAEFN